MARRGTFPKWLCPYCAEVPILVRLRWSRLLERGPTDAPDQESIDYKGSIFRGSCARPDNLCDYQELWVEKDIRPFVFPTE